MADDYPDADEEYELMYADEFELIRNTEDDSEQIQAKKALQAKRSLDFSSPITKKATTTSTEVIETDISLTPNLPHIEDDLSTTNIASKRTVDDLFGDINDIDFNDIGVPSKRQKTEEEEDLELIEKILENRRLKQIVSEPTSGTGKCNLSNYVAKDNLSLDIPRWAFMPITNSDGERIYVRLESEDSWDQSMDSLTNKISFRETYAEAWEEAKKYLQKKREAPPPPAAAAAPAAPARELWVHKYRPRCYAQLLSEEPVNRALLHWLRLWDKTVFKRDYKQRSPQQRTAFSRRAGQFQLTNKWRGKRDEEPETEADGRPRHKVALLAGPPGVGKTTLAHLLAKLAGYRVVELNASDERSGEAFRSALQAATLMRSVLDAERRPNCLVLDEIDGAPLPTVELLVRWCTAAGAEPGTKKRGNTQPLRRPVIAICNDLYAPSLRPLRAIANIIHAPAITHARLAARLAQLCAAEGGGGGAAAAAAGSLVARARGDVRAAVSALSLLQAGKQLTVEELSCVGEKDVHRSLVQCLQVVFTLSAEPAPAQRCVAAVHAAAEYDRTIEGIFENYLSARVDSHLVAASRVLGWLRTYDAAAAWTARTQNYAAYGLLPWCAAACHAAVAVRGGLRLKYPLAAQEVHRKQTEIDSIVTSVYRGAAAGRGARRALRLDVLPLLPHLLAPRLRSGNVQLCSAAERAALLAAAGAMCDYGVRYVQRRAADGLYEHALEPDICRVAFFGSEERGRPPPAVRQAIAREQQLELIRRSEIQTGPASSQRPPPPPPPPPGEARLPNHLQTLTPKEVAKTTPQVHKDFFCRVVPIIQSSQSTPGSRDVISSSRVFYQYREGFNNAVRRAVRLRDLQ